MVSIAKTIGENGQVAGIDISEAMLGIARKKLFKHNNVILKKWDLENIPYSDNYFDAVVSVNVMHYFHNLMDVLKEFYRILKPGGRMVLLGFCTDFLFFQAMEKMWRILVPSHVRAYSLDELSQKLKEAGFKIVENKRFKASWFWGSMAVKVKKDSQQGYRNFQSIHKGGANV